MKDEGIGEKFKTFFLTCHKGLLYLPESWKDIKQLVEIAVKANGMNLAFASKRLQADLDIVKLAVNNDGKALAFASRELQGNRDVVMLAIENKGVRPCFRLARTTSG